MTKQKATIEKEIIAYTRKSLQGLAPVNEREAEAKETALLKIEELTHPFDRNGGNTHFTGSAVITGPEGILLHKHKIVGAWWQPGGHIDAGETPSDTAWREAFEETGLRCTWTEQGPQLFHLDVHEAAHGHTHLDLRYRLYSSGPPAPPEGESQEVRWFTYEEAEKVADAGLRGLLNKLAVS